MFLSQYFLSFTRIVAPASLLTLALVLALSNSALAQQKADGAAAVPQSEYVGTYTATGSSPLTLKVKMKKESLSVTVVQWFRSSPLAPEGANTFALTEAPQGFTVTFTVEDGRVTGLDFAQGEKGSVKMRKVAGSK